MKRSELRQIIKEEIQNIKNENTIGSLNKKQTKILKDLVYHYRKSSETQIVKVALGYEIYTRHFKNVSKSDMFDYVCEILDDLERKGHLE